MRTERSLHHNILTHIPDSPFELQTQSPLELSTSNFSQLPLRLLDTHKEYFGSLNQKQGQVISIIFSSQSHLQNRVPIREPSELEYHLTARTQKNSCSRDSKNSKNRSLTSENIKNSNSLTILILLHIRQ